MNPDRCPTCGRPIGRKPATGSLVCTSCLLRVGCQPWSGIEPGESVLEYLRMLNVIGEGPRGRVFLAEWTTPGGGMVALKCAQPGSADFAVEPRLASLDHPSIAAIHELGTSPRLGAYAVSDYVPGVPITRFCEREQLSTLRRLDLWLQAADAIAYAHACSLSHLNLKPTNLLVVSGNVYVLDFERALPVGPMAPTIYRAPEQGNGATSDSRSDVFALGTLLAELVATHPDAVLVQAIARHATRADPDERPQSIAAFASEVRTCLHALSNEASV